MYNIEIYITAEEDNEYDVDVFYEEEDNQWDIDDEFSRGHFKTKVEAEEYVESMKNDSRNGTDYYITNVDYRVSASCKTQ